jgi:NADH:ubiquinone oxidoreductase subunit F (NADH-binding)
MDIEELRAAAEAECSYLKDSSYVRILIASPASHSGAAGLLGSFQDAVHKSGLRARVVRTGSFGCYDIEPIVMIEGSDSSTVLYHSINPEDVSFLTEDCAAKNVHKSEKALCRISDGALDGIPHISELPLFGHQNRMALRNAGRIDPDDINHYILRGQGYSGLSRALGLPTRELLDRLMGLVSERRTESGDSEAEAWKAFHESDACDKYLICNAIEADPKAMTVRMLFESDPHSVLEGMLISARAVNASHCLILVKENSNWMPILGRALEQMKGRNLLGSRILDSDFESQIEIRVAAESSLSGYIMEQFRCLGEKQPVPHLDPRHPDLHEFTGRPSIVTSPEVMAVVAASIGKEPGTFAASRVITLSGCVVHKYTVEVDPKTTIDFMIDVIGGRIADSKAAKAVKIGGPAGLFVAADGFNQPLAGAMEHSGCKTAMGSLEVFDADTSIVGAALCIMSHIQTQSCGRCLFCRECSLQIWTILEDIAAGRGNPDDLELLADLGKDMKDSCLCDFGRSAPDPLLSSLELFRSEYNECVKGAPLKKQR